MLNSISIYTDNNLWVCVLFWFYIYLPKNFHLQGRQVSPPLGSLQQSPCPKLAGPPTPPSSRPATYKANPTTSQSPKPHCFYCITRQKAVWRPKCRHTPLFNFLLPGLAQRSYQVLPYVFKIKTLFLISKYFRSVSSKVLVFVLIK